jgi:hypothetical protein
VRLLNRVARRPDAAAIYLLAGCAECRGDQSTADDAWLVLRDQVGRRTGLVLSRAAGAEISRASLSCDPKLRRGAIASSADALCRAGGTDWADTRWAHSAVAGLDARGDASGALLLALALRHTVHQPPQSIVDELARRTPHGAMRRLRMWAVGGILAGLAVLWLSPSPMGWLLFALAALGVVKGRLRIAGLSAEDSGAWVVLRLRSLSVGYGPDPVALPRWTLFGTFWLVAALGMAGAAPLTGLQFGGPRSFVIFFAGIALPLTVVLLIQRRHRSKQIAQARHEAALLARDAHTDAGRCRCWSHDVVLNVTARLYLHEHLTPVDLSQGAGSLVAVSELGTWVARCPISHISWLGWQTTPEGGLIAVRGAPTGGVAWSAATG